MSVQAPVQARATRRLDVAPALMALVVLGVAVYLTVGLVTMQVPSTAKPPGPKVFPTIITLLSYVVGLTLLVQSLRGHAHSTTELGDSPDTQRGEPLVSPRHLALLFGSLLAFGLLLTPLGWLFAASGLFFGVTVALGARPSVRTAAIGVILAATIQLLFAGLLGLALPTGFIGGL